MNGPWTDPTAWLVDRIMSETNLDALRVLAQTLAEDADPDDIGELFWREMEDDEYFVEADREESWDRPYG